jgi:hypothetical protein
MLRSLRRWFSRGSAADPIRLLAAEPDGMVSIDGRAFDMAAVGYRHDGLPHPRWELVHDWLDTLPETIRAEAWLSCERAWLGWLQPALGAGYRCRESAHALLLSAQSQRQAQLTLGYLDATLRRVSRLLEDMAQRGDPGKEIMIVFHDADTYYRYVSAFSPPGTEATPSSGMHIAHGCGHFVTYDADLGAMEAVIVHEMTHSLLGHRPIPLWLNEGIAVNTEVRFGHHGSDAREALGMLQRHRAFWTAAQLEDFWAARWHRAGGDANELFYDLARIIVSQLAGDWTAFKRFVATAEAADAGRAAAAAELGVDLDAFVHLLLGRGTPA